MSIQVVDFSIDIGDWQDVSTPITFNAEVIDTLYSITSLGTYYELNGQTLTTSVSGSGPYYVTSEAVTITGSCDLYLYLRNSNNDTTNNYYGFMFGYHIEYSVPYGTDWGLNKEVLIKAIAENEVTCPNVDSFCSYFTTRDYHTADLGASIFPKGWKNLNSRIVGKMAALTYGDTFTITIKGIKDYNNNRMEDIVFTFTIEESPN